MPEDLLQMMLLMLRPVKSTPEIFAKHFPGTQIWIFEPLKENCKIIQSMCNKYPEFVLIPKAAGNEIGKTQINKATSVSASSIFELNANNLFAESLKTVGKEEIEITRIDDVIPKDKPISIMKLDVQGFELEVLKGAKNTLPNINLIVLEVNNHDGYVGSSLLH